MHYFFPKLSYFFPKSQFFFPISSVLKISPKGQKKPCHDATKFLTAQIKSSCNIIRSCNEMVCGEINRTGTTNSEFTAYLTNMKICNLEMMRSLKKSHTPDGIRTRTANAPTTEPKSRLPDAVCQRLYLYDTMYRIAVLFIETMHHVICQPDLPTTADNLE